MAASNKPTAVHFTAVFFGMTTLILAVTTYLGYKERGEALRDATAKADEAVNASSGLSNEIANVDAIKARLGYNFAEVGAETPPPANTVLGQLNEDLTKYGKDLQEATVAATLAAMRAALDQTQKDLAEKELALKDMQARMLALQGQYQQQMDQITASQTGSETNLQNFIAQRDEILKTKDQELTTLRGDYNREQVEKEQLREQMNRQKRDLDDQISNLLRTNDILRRELDGIKRISFEVPDGEIRNVDNTTRTVWINLGEDDNIRPQVTFSVYDQNHDGVARGAEDIKGSVEVVRVLGPHLCEARILEEQLNRPMAPGDVVYSPIWTPGLIEEFAVVGEVDFNRDGQSDRKQFKDLLNHAGAKLSIEVDDDGNRNPPDAKVDVNTKFLIIGHIPDPAQFAAQDPNLERVKRMIAQRGELQTQAQQQGVRIVNLNDFLAYMGYKPHQRLFLPGSDMPYTLNQGKRQTGVTDTVGGSGSSAGNTSEVFRRNRATGGTTTYGN